MLCPHIIGEINVGKYACKVDHGKTRRANNYSPNTRRLHKTSPSKRRCDVSHSSVIISLSLSAETTVHGK